jgi:hypothetical protein
MREFFFKRVVGREAFIENFLSGKLMRQETFISATMCRIFEAVTKRV